MIWKIIKAFSLKNQQCFSFREVIAQFPDKDQSNLSKQLAIMVRQGILKKLCRDFYCIIPLNASPESYVPNKYITAKCMMKGKEYYIAYSSAMHIRGLSDQEGSKTLVVVLRQMQPPIKKVAGTEFQFICGSYRNFFGYDATWINSSEQVMVSDLEKTIVDAVTKPHLCGGIIKVGNAIWRANERIDTDKMFYYLARNGRQSAKKRYLFLLDLMELGWTSDHERMLGECDNGLSLLDSSGPNSGRKNARFGLKINVELTDLKNLPLSRNGFW
jgi:predicted transcriptional regulator of viral defense system